MGGVKAPARRLGWWPGWPKRAFDFVVASVGLIVLAPLLGVIALAIRLALGRPVIFAQRRPGRHARPFILYKFRTMSAARAADGRLRPDRERLTRLGRLLRGTSVDELPGLINVVKGDMSLVGPRPLLMEYLPLYTREQARRHEVRPGITGWAQLNGRNTLPWEHRFALDVWYVEHQSCRLDARILLLTVWKALAQAGVSQPGEGTEEDFRGRATAKDVPAPDIPAPHIKVAR
jgi:lipopolysaccharide/colanic/teichoic acid biosynthesis glycosyltransferase